MDVSFAAFVLGIASLALLGLLFLAWRRDRGEPSWRLKTALRLQEHDQRLNGLNGLLKEQDELRRVVRGELLACLEGQAGELDALKEKAGKLEKTVEVLAGALSRAGGIVDGHAGRIAAVELKQETERNRRLGWEEGFSEGIKIQLRHLENRVEAIERGKLVFVRDDGPRPSERLYGLPPQPRWLEGPSRTFPGTDPLVPPFKLTCQAGGQDAEGRR